MLGTYARPNRHLPAPTPEQTLQWMAKFIRQGQYDQRLRELVEREIVAELFPHDYLSEYAAILNWVRTNIRYSRDPRTIEQVKTPAVIVETKTGDCDDMSVLIGALVGLVGGQVRLVAGGFPNAPRTSSGRRILSHVWLEAFDPTSSSWVVLDPVPGRKVHQMLRRMTNRLTMEVLS
jgi:transglutaminase-like putative cysteine protease